MIRMDQYSFIRTAHRVYGKSIRQISRETGHSRETIRKVLHQEPYVYTPRQQQVFPPGPGGKGAKLRDGRTPQRRKWLQSH